MFLVLHLTRIILIIIVQQTQYFDIICYKITSCDIVTPFCFILSHQAPEVNVLRNKSLQSLLFHCFTFAVHDKCFTQRYHALIISILTKLQCLIDDILWVISLQLLVFNFSQGCQFQTNIYVNTLLMSGKITCFTIQTPTFM